MTEIAAGAAKGSPLRQRMIEQMRIANLEDSTQSAYLFKVERLASPQRSSGGRGHAGPEALTVGGRA